MTTASSSLSVEGQLQEREVPNQNSNNDTPATKSATPERPPRQAQSDMHKRSSSTGGINLPGVEHILHTLTPPIWHRKRSVQDKTLEFHNQNQQFLRQASKLRPKAPSSSSSYRHESPRSRLRKQHALASIGDDDWEHSHDEDEAGADEVTIDRIELDMEQLYADRGNPGSSYHSVAYSCNSSFPDVSSSDSSIDSSYKPPAPPPFNRTVLEQRLDRERDERDEQRRTDVETRLLGVLERQISERPGDKQQFIKEYMKELENEKESLIRQWKREFQEDQRRIAQERAPHTKFYARIVQPCFVAVYDFLAVTEVFLSNLPLTIGAVALSWVTMGVVWFKFMEENIDICKPVHYHSPFCSFPEFPGCFDCEKGSWIYQMVLYFHYSCNIIGGTMAISFLLKGIVAWQVVADELTNPTTATPVGVICITLVCVFAGQGLVGEIIVLLVSAFHCAFAFWFLYMAIIKYKMLPDPSWFPSTVGISYAAIKTWLYFPTAGKTMLFICTIFFCGTFFISLIRVALNQKIAAPVCWIQVSAPSVTLYALTMVSQPSRSQELRLQESVAMQNSYHQILHEYYMPLQHFMMFLSLIGMASALHSLWSRWDKFRLIQFSPAHVAFCFPTLSHTNAIQAYRGAVDAFSTIPTGSMFKIVLFSYWFICLIVGTVVNLIFTYKFMIRLPQWTNVRVSGETEPPAPADTIMSLMLPDTREFMDGPFVSPAVLQANEAGALVRVRRGTEDYRIHGPYVRTRQVTALGFDPTLNDADLRQERSALLDWVARNPPRTRHRTLSIPMMMKLKNEKGEGIFYGTFQEGESPDKSHKRSMTLS
jgi:tellurite resistance protein TehA-like permease